MVDRSSAAEANNYLTKILNLEENTITNQSHHEYTNNMVSYIINISLSKLVNDDIYVPTWQKH